MKRLALGFTAVVAVVALVASCGQARAADRPPNIIFILADDLGYGEVGAYGQTRISTPHIDRMAAEGMRFTQFYSGSPVCAPSRAAFLTGLHTGHGYVRDNKEFGGWRDDDERGQLPLKPGTLTVGRFLQQAGYRTALVGKWGLGGPGTTGLPNDQGFDFFFGYLTAPDARGRPVEPGLVRRLLRSRLCAGRHARPGAAVRARAPRAAVLPVLRAADPAPGASGAGRFAC